MYALYKNIDPNSPYFGSMYYAQSYEGLKVGHKNSVNECVLITNNIEQINSIINTVPDEVYKRIAIANSTNPDGTINEELLETNMREYETIIQLKNN